MCEDLLRQIISTNLSILAGISDSQVKLEAIYNQLVKLNTTIGGS